jgi:asparagine synthase (glutamine-hydrolysing)
MCGIAGTAGESRGRETDAVGAALGLLAPRGPDGSGRAEGRLGAHPLRLGARRLSLADPSGPGQPFRRPSGSLLVWNGEVYNHSALRRELESAGESFSTRDDGEVLAALLDREGPAGLARVEGSYALAFFRAPDGCLWLARDPLGVRPLCYAALPDGFAFASTVEGLVGTGWVAPRPDLDALAAVLGDGVVPAPRSAVEGVRKVLPGEVLRLGPTLTVERSTVPEGAPSAEGPSGVLDALRAAVADRIELERPWAIFLSGGVDSAVVAALAAERATAEGVRPVAYTVGFPGYLEADEARRAARTAARLSVEHRLVACPRDPTPWVLGAARAFDEPFADSSAVPTWGLAREAGRSVRVALTGTGGDEVFGGYRRYWLLGAGPWLRAVPARLRLPVAAVLARTVPEGARLLRASADPEGLYRGLRRLQPLDEARALFGPALAASPRPPGGRGPRTAREAMADDIARYLPDDLLVKEDRSLMAHGVEGRHPFLDRRVRRAAEGVEVLGLPHRRREKQVLRAFVREVVDPDLARVRKRGFAFPVDEAYRGPLRALASEVLGSRRARERGFFDPDGVRRLLRDHSVGARSAGAVVHALLMVELWARRVLDGDPILP